MADKKLVESITSMEEDFAQWYTDVVKKAELIDYTSVKGCMVIKPAGYAIWENIQKNLDAMFKEVGVQNVYLPMFIPESLLQKEKDHVEGYITIEGADRILDKIRNLIDMAEERVYISCTRNYLLLFIGEIEKLIARHKKVVIITDQPVNFENVKVYLGTARGMQIGIITDSRYVLTGEYGEGSLNTCLYSGQKNFVELYKRALSNEIKLLAMQEENKQ